MDKLPDLVLEHVFKYLNVQDSCSMRLVCSTFNQTFLQFRNPNFINSLHYVQLESDQKLRLFLSTFSQAEVPIPFPRFLWNVHIGSDAEVNDLGTLNASTMVELSINVERSIDIYANIACIERFQPLSDRESLMRVSTLLHLVASTLEVLQITFGYWYEEISLMEIPVPVLPKLTILDVDGGNIHEWIGVLIGKAPVLEFVSRRYINSPYITPIPYSKLAGSGKKLIELEYNTQKEDDQRYTEKCVSANARTYRRDMRSFFWEDETIRRLWTDQIRNFEALMEFDFGELTNHVFPRVKTLRTSPLTWLENPLKVLSPTKLPRLRRVKLTGVSISTNLSTLDFPAELSSIYPNVVELFMHVSGGRHQAFPLLPYYKLFPNVTTLKVYREVMLTLTGLLNHFPKVRHLVLGYSGGMYIGRRTDEDHDFDLECGGKPDVVSFKNLERLEYWCLDGSEEVISRLLRSAKASALSQLKSVYLWYAIPRKTLRSGRTTIRQYGETLKEQELPNVTQLQEFFEIKWWISQTDLIDLEVEQLV